MAASLVRSSRAVALTLAAPAAALAAALLAAACSSSDAAVAASDGGTSDAATSGPDAAASDAASNDGGGAGCARTPAPENRARKVVLSHPFLASGDKANDFEVIDLAADGTLSRPATPVKFQMGVAIDAPIVFTPDGEIGLVPQDDGTIGVFRLPAGGGAPVVVQAAFDGGFYAGHITLAPDGSHGWVTDENTTDNGGGVYGITIACDGTVTSQGLVVPGGNAHALAFLPGDPAKAVLAARAAFTSPAGTDVHLVDLAAGKTLGSVAAFGDDKAIVSSLVVMPGGKHALVADDGLSAGSRLAVVALDGSALTAVPPLLVTDYPAALIASPFGNAALVLNGDAADAIHLLSYDATRAAPFVLTGEVAYAFGKPQIPSTASLLERGTLRGTVIIGENSAVRRMVFNADGTVKDAQKLAYPDTIEDIVGVVGVQP
ncbi:MAG: hypothetical protein JWP97_1504 [Labilithrix sp.]|nr:hypothetical protein [Labilithrix sp.]